MVWVLSSIIIIAQSETWKIEYGIAWLKKISLEQLLFEWGNFSKPLSFLSYSFQRLFGKNYFVFFVNCYYPFWTFVNCEDPYLAEGFLHNLCPCFNIVFAPLGVITRTNNKIVDIVVASECYLIINPFLKN